MNFFILKNLSNLHVKSCFLLLIFLLISIRLSAQKAILHHQSIGASVTASTINDNLYISSSVGQHSVSGSNVNLNYSLVQGFQQYVKYFHTNNLLEKNNLDIVLYPNPFVNELQILLPEMMMNTQVYIHDISGNIVFSQNFTEAIKYINIFPNYLPQGSYVLTLVTRYMNYKKIILRK